MKGAVALGANQVVTRTAWDFGALGPWDRAAKINESYISP